MRWTLFTLDTINTEVRSQSDPFWCGLQSYLLIGSCLNSMGSQIKICGLHPSLLFGKRLNSIGVTKKVSCTHTQFPAVGIEFDILCQFIHVKVSETIPYSIEGRRIDLAEPANQQANNSASDPFLHLIG